MRNLSNPKKEKYFRDKVRVWIVVKHVEGLSAKGRKSKNTK